LRNYCHIPLMGGKDSKGNLPLGISADEKLFFRVKRKLCQRVRA